jgi:hypothetical protein
VVWAILALPHPARPYGIAFVGAVFVWGMWMVWREDRQGFQRRTDGVDCRCKWCVKQEEQESHEEEGR